MQFTLLLLQHLLVVQLHVVCCCFYLDIKCSNNNCTEERVRSAYWDEEEEEECNLIFRNDLITISGEFSFAKAFHLSFFSCCYSTPWLKVGQQLESGYLGISGCFTSSPHPWLVPFLTPDNDNEVIRLLRTAPVQSIVICKCVWRWSCWIGHLILDRLASQPPPGAH